MYGESVELAAGPNRGHRSGSRRCGSTSGSTSRTSTAWAPAEACCIATPSGMRFEADKPADSFEAAFTTLEPLQVDYLAKTLRVKQKAGKTWNFTSDSADALLVFQKRVEAARARL